MQAPYASNEIQGILHTPDHPNGQGIALTHGASSNSNAPLLVKLADAFSGAGFVVLRYDLPFRVKRPKGSPFPAGAAEDREGVARATAAVKSLVPGRVIVGGSSYGGRQSTMAAAERPDMAGALLLLSYPLHPPGRPEQMRTAHFPSLRTPALFVHGTADPFGSIEELRAAIALIPAPTDLFPIQSARHDLKRAGDLSAEILARLHPLVGS